MALAVTSHEVRVAEILVASPEPMTANDLVATLKDTFHMTRLKKSDVNSTLYATPAYGSVPGSQPPLWFVRGTAADKAPAPAPAEAEEEKVAGAELGSLYNNLCGFSPPEVAPAGEFGGGAVVVAGETSDLVVMGEVVSILAKKGGGTLRCLVGHPAGEAALDVANVLGTETVSVGYAGADPRRAVADAHYAVMTEPTAPVALCIVGPPATGNYGVHNILAAFESRGLPVYHYVAGTGAEPYTSDCGAC